MYAQNLILCIKVSLCLDCLFGCTPVGLYSNSFFLRSLFSDYRRRVVQKMKTINSLRLFFFTFQDKDMNMLVYREEQDDEEADTWELVCRLVHL